MKTPFDTAERIRRRELDEARQALSAAEAQFTAFSARLEATEAALRSETEVAASDPRIDIGPFAAAKRAEIAALYREIGKIEVEIDRLRDRLMQRFEALKPIESAGEDYRVARRRDAARREQGRLDEVAARRR